MAEKELDSEERSGTAARDAESDDGEADRSRDDAEQGDTDEQGAAGEGGEEEPQNRRSRRAAAAQARKARVRERREAEAVGLDAQEILDDALVRSTDKASKWFKKNSQILQWTFVIGIVGWAGWGLYNWRATEARAEASSVLATALSAERGKIGDPAEQGQPNEQKVIDPAPIYADQAALRKAAIERFEAASAERPGSGTALYALLGKGAVLYDDDKYDEALAAFQQVADADLAKSDPELRGRALEGLGLVYEAKGDKEAALKSYAQLENTQAPGNVELGLYQRARLQTSLGQLDAAKESVQKLREKLGGAKEPLGFSTSYLERGLAQLSAELGLEQPAETTAGSRPITPEQLKALQQQVQQQIDRSTRDAKDAPEVPSAVEGTPVTAPAEAPQQPE